MAREDERERIRTDSIRQKEARIVDSTASLRYVLFVMVTREGGARPSFLLAEAARSRECVPSVRAAKDSLAALLRPNGGKSEAPHQGSWHVMEDRLRNNRRVGRVKNICQRMGE